MLEAPIEFYNNVTDAYFPLGNDWHRYMDMVVHLSEINVEFGIEVDHIDAGNKPCVYLVDGSKRCANKRVFVGTGLQPKFEPLLEAMGGIPYGSMTKELAKDKVVCILGNGNAGHEISQNVFNVADRVQLIGKRRQRFFSVTRYTGDVRLRFLQTFENGNAKLLDTIGFLSDGQHLNFRGGFAKNWTESQKNDFALTLETVMLLGYYNCELLVIATGFLSNVPGLKLPRGGRFPRTDDWYQSPDNPNVHYIGWLMHERDFRRSAGGFLSGFRYLIRNLVHHVREVDQGIPYPYLLLNASQVVAHVTDRIQYTDDLLLMQDGVTLKDLIIPAGTDIEDGRITGGQYYRYYEGITHDFHPTLMKANGAIKVFFAWGDGRTRTVNHVFESVYEFSDKQKAINQHLHPIVEVDGKVRHLRGDVLLVWQRAPHVDSIERTMTSALMGDLSGFQRVEDVPYEDNVANKKFTFNTTEYEVDHDDVPVSGGGIGNDLFQALVEYTMSNGDSESSLAAVRNAMMGQIPELFENELDDTTCPDPDGERQAGSDRHLACALDEY